MRSDHRHAVFVVDDYDDLREALMVMLDAAGFEARGASSGHGALEALATGYHPCVILLDVRMPGMDGWAVWEALQACPATVDIPVMFLSGDPSVVRGHAAGIVGLLGKPCDEPELVAAVTAHARCPIEQPGSN